MKIYHNFDNLSGCFTACIGYFDGVHLGHRYLFEQVRRRAAEAGTQSAVITFANHPRSVVQPGAEQKLIDTPSERLELIGSCGLDACMVLSFDEALRQLTAEAFMTDVLARRLHVRQLLAGYDTRFGRGRTDGFGDYVRYGAACGIEVLHVGAYAGAAGEASGQAPCSSSLVREALTRGDVALAALLLGRPYRLTATVVSGQGLGRRLGFPTANLRPECRVKIVPRRGVYAVTATTADGATYPAMLNIGVRPTVSGSEAADGAQETLEAHLTGFEGDLYGQSLTIGFIERLRDERRMASLDELRRQLQLDQSKSSSIVAAKAAMSR